MRALILLCTLVFPSILIAQTAAFSPSQTQSELNHALAGDWAGFLQYRDYSEPATSIQRVQLPAWLSIAPTSSGQFWHYIYDDGPSKTVEETDLITFHPADSTYLESVKGKPTETFQVSGYEALRGGLGQLILSGAGTDNDRPSETRVTVTVRRNLINILEEVRPVGSTAPFVFRHRYSFTRINPPALAPTHWRSLHSR
jgi:hypothetical protein